MVWRSWGGCLWPGLSSPPPSVSVPPVSVVLAVALEARHGQLEELAVVTETVSAPGDRDGGARLQAAAASRELYPSPCIQTDVLNKSICDCESVQSQTNPAAFGPYVLFTYSPVLVNTVPLAPRLCFDQEAPGNAVAHPHLFASVPVLTFDLQVQTCDIYSCPLQTLCLQRWVIMTSHMGHSWMSCDFTQVLDKEAGVLTPSFSNDNWTDGPQLKSCPPPKRLSPPG